MPTPPSNHAACSACLRQPSAVPRLHGIFCWTWSGLVIVVRRCDLSPPRFRRRRRCWGRNSPWMRVGTTRHSSGRSTCRCGTDSTMQLQALLLLMMLMMMRLFWQLIAIDFCQLLNGSIQHVGVFLYRSCSLGNMMGMKFSSDSQ